MNYVLICEKASADVIDRIETQELRVRLLPCTRCGDATVVPLAVPLDKDCAAAIVVCEECIDGEYHELSVVDATSNQEDDGR